MMKRRIATLLIGGALAFAVPSHALDVNANSIKVIVTGLRSNDGDVYCALFNSADGFPGDASKAIKNVKSKIDGGQAVCNFTGTIPGDYAVSVFHDENGNGKLDTNFMGIPKEGVGASNGAVGKFGPPKFADARFNYAGGFAVTTIHLTYIKLPF